MNFDKQLFKKINKNELLFDILIIISSLVIQWLLTNEVIKLRGLTPFVYIIFSFLFVVSIAYMMGVFFAKYNKKKINLAKYMAWLILPGVFIITFIPVIAIHLKGNIQTIIMFAIMLLIVITVIAGKKIEQNDKTYKKIIEKTAMYFSAITLSIVETVIIMSDASITKHTNKDTIAIITGLILVGYVPYRLVIAFAPPVNKINLIFALLAIIIAVVGLSLGFN